MKIICGREAYFAAFGTYEGWQPIMDLDVPEPLQTCHGCGKQNKLALCRDCRSKQDPRADPDNGDVGLLEMGWTSHEFDRPKRRW
jgi:hypothetical protein